MLRWSRAAVETSLALLMVVATSAPGMAATYPRPLNQEWWFAAWDIENKVWPISQGRGVTVAVVDTGVQADIPDLAGVVLPGTDASGGSGDGRTDLDDGDVPGHGTGMSSLIASQGSGTGFLGIAPKAKIMPVTTLHLRGAAKGIRFAVDHGARVISISQGYPSACPDDVQEAVAHALEHDVPVIAGAGNTGDESNRSEWPANCVGVLAVGAVDFRARPWAKTQRQPYVTVAAPGVRVGSVLRDGQVHTSNGGTSGATALTSATAALVRSKYPKMSARAVVQRLIASTRDTGPKGKDDLTGYGVVRPYHALVDRVPKNSPNPVFAAYDRWRAANDKGASASRPAISTPNSGPDWGRVATLAIGLAAVIAIIIGAAAVLRRGRRRPATRAPQYRQHPPYAYDPPHPQGAGQPFGGDPRPQPGQPPAPGAPPQLYPPPGPGPHGAPPAARPGPGHPGHPGHADRPSGPWTQPPPDRRLAEAE